MRKSTTALVVFARTPARETKWLGLGRRADLRLQRFLLHRTLELARSCADTTDVIVALDGPPQAFDELSGPWSIIAQHGEDFGARLVDVAQRVARRGYSRMVLLGTDTPALERRDVVTALESTETVVGPACDGGLYLLGIDVDALAVLDGLPWQSDRLLGELERALRARDLRHVSLRRRADLDRPDDVQSALQNLARAFAREFGVALDNAHQTALQPLRALVFGSPRRRHGGRAPARAPPV